jgi:hypothetical protein
MTDPIVRLLVDLTQGFPTDALIDKRVYGLNLEQIKEAKSQCVIDRLELAVPNGRRTVATVFYSEFVTF